MRTAKRVALIEQVSLAECVDSRQLQSPVAPSCSGREVDGGVAWKMCRTVTIEEAGAVAEISSDPERARQLRGYAGTERLALIVIEKEPPLLRRREIGETAHNTALPLDRLMRVGNVNARATGEERRLDGGLE